MSRHRSGGELHRDVLRQLRWRGDQPLDMRRNIRAKRWQLNSRACQAGLQAGPSLPGCVSSAPIRSGAATSRAVSGRMPYRLRSVAAIDV